MKNIILQIIFALLILNYTNVKGEETLDSTIIDCDSVYNGKGFQITLIKFDSIEGYDNKHNNSVFILTQKINGKNKEIFRDSIYSSNQSIEFADYNNDKIKDDLIQNIEDVRSIGLIIYI